MPLSFEKTLFLVSNQNLVSLGGIAQVGKGGSVTGQPLGLCSMATLDFGSPARRFDTSAALGTCCALQGQVFLVIQVLASQVERARIAGEGKEIALCLTFPSVRQVLAVLTLEEQISMAAGTGVGTVERSPVLGAAGGCRFLLVLG